MSGRLLRLSVLLLAIVFMGMSFGAIVGYSGQFTISGYKPNSSATPSEHSNSAFDAGIVKYASASTAKNSPAVNIIKSRDTSLSINNRIARQQGAGNASISVGIKVLYTINVSKDPGRVAYDDSNGYIYVVNACSNTTSVINGTTNKVVQNITVGKCPFGVTYDSSNGYIYVANFGSSNVSVINPSTEKVIQNIRVGKGPCNVAIDRSNENLYVSNRYSNNVSVINGATNTVIQNITVGKHPAGEAFDLSNGYIYVTNCCDGNVSVINGATNKVVQNITVGSEPVSIICDISNGYLYVSDYGAKNVSVINTSTDKVIQNITVGGFPNQAVFDNFNGYIYVANSGSNNVSVINTFIDKVIQSINVSQHPCGVAFDNSNGYIYVTNFFSNNVSVLGYQTYSVTFTETGLPSGTTWYANVTNKIGYVFHGSSTTSTITFNLVNGTYSFTNSTADKLFAPSSYAGSFTVSGSAVNLPTVVFSFTSKVTFTETGLPSGTIWYANVTNSIGHIFHGSSTTSIITFNLVNGTYSFTNSTGDKSYAPSSPAGTFAVAGSAMTLPTVVFSLVTYKVTFKETGLPSGSDWYVNITGHDSGALTGANYSVMLTNGTYAYTIGTNNTNFYANGGTVVINGQSKTVSVTFTAYSQPSKPSNSGISGIELYSIIGVVVAVVVVGSAIFMMRRNK
ncbi:MAG: hypothetical protein ACYCSG_07025 [Thermoplasmataceae archaeon]